MIKFLIGCIFAISACSPEKHYMELLEVNTQQEPMETIVIIYSPIGHGHLSAAKTIKKDLIKNNSKLNVVLVDITFFGLKMFGSRELYKKVDQYSYMTIFNHFPNIYTKIYDSNMNRNIKEMHLDYADLDVHEDELLFFLQKLASHHDLTHIISTHYMGARAIGSLRSRGHFTGNLAKIKLSWVNTDYFIGYFPRISQYLDKTFLAHEEMTKAWISRGVPEDRVTTSGMPMPVLTPRKWTSNQRKELFKKLGFQHKENSLLFTIATGGAGVGDFRQIVSSLVETFEETPFDIYIIAVPALDEGNYNNLIAMTPKLPKKVQLKTFKGLIPKNDLMTYIEASDLYVTKAGGLSPTEAFMLKKPVVLLNIFGGHERENAIFFRGLNLAQVVEDYQEIGTAAYRALFNKNSRHKSLAAQEKFRINLQRAKIIDFLTENNNKLTAKKETANKIRFMKIKKEGSKALQELKKNFPSNLEIFLSYSLVQKGKSTNPFGHLALRIEDKIYTTDANAQKKASNTLHTLNLKDYLYGNLEKSNPDDFADLHGQTWGRDMLSMRLQVSPERLRYMKNKIDQFNSEKVKYHRFTSNCSHHVNQILKSGNLKLECDKNSGPIKSPLLVFHRIYKAFEKEEKNLKFVFYQQIYDGKSPILPEFKYHLSKYPMNLDLINMLNWALFDKYKPSRGELERHADFRLAYYPEDRIVFENISSYRDNGFENQQSQTAEKIVLIPTFDDGPINRSIWKKHVSICPSKAEMLEPLNKILNTLDERNIKAVFYVSAWGNIDIDPECPTRKEDELRSMFQEGVRKIAQKNHLIALHSYDHEAYRRKAFTSKDIKVDLDRLNIELEKVKVPISPLWRTPYGSHYSIQKALASEMDLVPRLWRIDSFDYLDHDDSPVKKLFSNSLMWRMATQVGIAYTTNASAASDKEPYLDILFHVNSRTSKKLASILNDVESYLSRNQDESKYFWSRSKKDMENGGYLR